MAGGKLLLDTVIVAAYFNREAAIREKLKDITVYVSSITVGELYFGAYNSQQVTSNVKQIEDFIDINTILPCDEITSDHYGQVKNLLRAKGRPIPENDIWIAATALQYGLTVITRDTHFREVDGLPIEVW
jgi:tRNA(fMet)-specific endonuclease VapC